MSRLDYHRTVIAYHGCDQEVVERVLSGRDTLKRSENSYDWLGSGIYFWEYGPARALQWAIDLKKRRSDSIRTPAVIGALIHLGTCFDLLDLHFTEYLEKLFRIFEQTVSTAGAVMPTNEGPPGNPDELVLRKLDCAMLNWAVPFVESEKGQKFHTVRGVFQEGAPAFPGSAIKLKSHIQIVVREPGAILGYFKPDLTNRDHWPN